LTFLVSSRNSKLVLAYENKTDMDMKLRYGIRLFTEFRLLDFGGKCYTVAKAPPYVPSSLWCWPLGTDSSCGLAPVVLCPRAWQQKGHERVLVSVFPPIVSTLDIGWY
jgi:hypothetical protein